MTKTNHVQREFAYCVLIDEFVDVPGPHIEKVCLGQECPYLFGSAQGDGVECYWDDGTEDGLTVDLDPMILKGRAEEQKAKGKPL